MSQTRTMICKLLIAIVGVVGFISPPPASADAISEEYRGLKLNAELRLASGKALEDGVVLMIPSPLGHHRMEIIVSVQDVLYEKGISTLAPSLSLGNDNRRWYIDCSKVIHFTSESIFDEIDFWIDWLRERGVNKITLLGHSASANYTTMYIARRPRPEVSGLILLAPATLAYGPQGIKRYENRFKVSLSEVLARADRYIAEGKGAVPMAEPTDYYFCPAAKVTADAFVSKYRDMGSQDFPTLWGTMSTPTLLVIGTGDKRSPQIVDEAQRAMDHGRVNVVTIENGGHFFKGLYTDKVVEAMVNFIASYH